MKVNIQGRKTTNAFYKKYGRFNGKGEALPTRAHRSADGLITELLWRLVASLAIIG